jgi:hypothetical protein
LILYPLPEKPHPLTFRKWVLRCSSNVKHFFGWNDASGNARPTPSKTGAERKDLDIQNNNRNVPNVPLPRALLLEIAFAAAKKTATVETTPQTSMSTQRHTCPQKQRTNLHEVQTL